ncbi:MAG: fibronectin type III domain-containing protein [Acidobacteriia bacterium]|nr:fibronectin type III domain-containing protein [Terriglobia bacterium]
MIVATSRRTALLMATAAAGLLVLLCTPALDGQGLNYDEVQQAPAAFLLLGRPMYAFVALAWHRIPLLTMSYIGAVKSDLFALWLWASGVTFTVVSWRLFGILLAAGGLWTFCVLSAVALTPAAIAVFAALFVSDVTTLLLVRHDWGPVDVALALRLIWLGLWIRTSADERPGSLSLLLLGAIPSFLVYEKLNNVILLGPLAVMMVVAERDARVRRAATIAAGFLIGLIPFALVNLIGHGISFHATVNQQPSGGTSAADVARFVLDVLALGDGDEMKQYILGVPSVAWARITELVFVAVCVVFVTAVAWTRGRRDRDARLAGASLAAYALTIVLLVILIMPISRTYHWFVATPLQYLAVAFGVQAVARAVRPRTAVLLVAPVLAIFLALRATNVVALERDFAARRTSPMFDPSNTTVAQYAVDHHDDATFIAADWGFGAQVYALSNGTLLMPEPFWSWSGQWDINRLGAYIAERGQPTFVLLPKTWRAPVAPEATADIVRSVEAITDGKALPVDPALERSPVIRVLKFAPPPPAETAPCHTAPDAPAGVRVVANSGGFVALAWNAIVARPDHYILDVATTPGGAGAPRELGRWPLFSLGGVQRGTYYVRVRAKNACGTSTASPDLKVVVQ